MSLRIQSVKRSANSSSGESFAESPKASCKTFRADFSPYLDGELTGVAMQSLAAHLEACSACAEEFAGWREMQDGLVTLGTAEMPEALQSRLRTAVALERERGGHLAWHVRAAERWHATFAPLAMRFAAASLATVAMIAGIALTLGTPSAVQANDEPLGAATAAHYAYSQVPPQPIEVGKGADGTPILVEAEIDKTGRVFDYQIIAGPSDPAVIKGIEDNLLESVFEPATIFGAPVNSHVMVTYTGVSVHG